MKKTLKQSSFSTSIEHPAVLFLMFNTLNSFSKKLGIMSYLFTSESVSEGHPDKVADQISDAILDKILAFDPNSKVACETLVTTGQVVLAGEIKTETYIDVQEVAREVINRIGYTKAEYRFDGDSCGVFSAIHEQSPDINRGVVREDPMNQGAGDQGMMFGYACRETDNYMPLSLELSHKLLLELAVIRREGKVMTYLRPDSKSQVTIEYSEEGVPTRIDTIVVSTQHDEFDADEPMLEKIKADVINILVPRVKAQLPERVQALFGIDIIYHVNPTGKFVIGGPHGDTGLTGRKIIVDTYGGKGAHGGGAFSGKDPSKVDRSAAYAARHIAKNLVAAGVSDEVLVQVSYAIGVAKPMNIFVNTYGKSKVNMPDSKIAEIVDRIFDMRPKAIEERLKLRNPIYEETAAYGHMGREPQKVLKTFVSPYFPAFTKEVELFTWEKLDYIEEVKKAFGV
jgi:S-adenosylmethionine synthetase